MAFWVNGECVSVSIEGSAWDEPTASIQILKCVVSERTTEADNGYEWSFG
jgi:hypothetical protein